MYPQNFKYKLCKSLIFWFSTRMGGYILLLISAWDKVISHNNTILLLTSYQFFKIYHVIVFYNTKLWWFFDVLLFEDSIFFSLMFISKLECRIYTLILDLLQFLPTTLALDSGVTRPPPLLSEADLLSCMDKVRNFFILRCMFYLVLSLLFTS